MSDYIKYMYRELGCHRFSAIRHAVCRSIRMADRFLCGVHARL